MNKSPLCDFFARRKGEVILTSMIMIVFERENKLYDF
jgi:hypothetical protein